MLNKVILMGRISNELEVKYTPTGREVLSFNLAVERSYAAKNEERQTDFLRCVAWGQTASFVDKYFGKGKMIAVVGNLRSRSYTDKNGVNQYITEVYVDEVSFTGEKTQQLQKSKAQPQQAVPTTSSTKQPKSFGRNSYDKDYEQDTLPLIDMAENAENYEVFNDDGVPF